MTPRKERLTVTVDPDVVEAGNRAVAAGLADSLSAWVNHALAERVSRDQRLEALSEAIAAYEAEHGEITTAEMEAQARRDRQAAIVVRGRTQRSPKPAAKRSRRRTA
jgi:glycerol dehydrogenase-like iron-containing ADH family enzyme